MNIDGLVASVVPYILGVVVGYLVYNHRRHDKTEKDVIILKTKMDSIKEDISEIRRMLEKLMDRKQ